MKKKTYAVLTLATLILLALPAVAQVPNLLNYQGRLTDPNGNPKGSPTPEVVRMQFAVYDNKDCGSGSQLPTGSPWSETQDVPVTNGIFNVLLGSVTALPTNLFEGEPANESGPLRFLQVTVSGEPLCPRRRIVSAAYSIQTPSGSGTGLWFGDGSDGDAMIAANTTLTSDKYYRTLTVNAGVTLNPGGYRIFVQEQLYVRGTIARDGNGGASDPGAGGAALPDGYLKGSPAGGNGASSTPSGGGNPGGAGSSSVNSIGSPGVAGGAGGNSASATGGPGGAGGGAAPSNVKLIANWHLASFLDVDPTGATVKFGNSGSGGGGGGGAGGNGTHGGAGGGAGSGGGIVAIYAKNIHVYSGGRIQANGGNGGNGLLGGGGLTGGGGGGGGAGGNGGQVILVYSTLINEGLLRAVGGIGGSGAPGGGGSPPGSAGAKGTDGAAGAVRLFQVSP